jgi:hypothetical protein
MGIVAFFSESMLALSNAIGREVAVKRLNTTTAGSTASAVPPEDLELICRLNAVDIALYTAAKSNFEQTKLPTLCPARRRGNKRGDSGSWTNAGGAEYSPSCHLRSPLTQWRRLRKRSVSL